MKLKNILKFFKYRFCPKYRKKGNKCLDRVKKQKEFCVKCGKNDWNRMEEFSLSDWEPFFEVSCNCGKVNRFITFVGGHVGNYSGYFKAMELNFNNSPHLKFEKWDNTGERFK